MTNAGWYPDPAGAQDTYRYWDGQAWSQMTTTTPPVGSAPQAPHAPQQPQQPAQPPQQPPSQPQTVYGAVPPVAPPPAGGYGQPQGGYGQPPGGGYGQQPWSPAPQQGGGGKGKVIGIVLGAVLALVLIGVGGFFGVKALTGDDDKDDKSADDDTSQTTDESGSTDSTDDPTDGTSSTVRPTGIQCTGGSPEPATPPAATATSLTGGGLTMPLPSGYVPDENSAKAHTFADGVQVGVKVVIEDKWISEYAVGGLAKANDFTSPEQAAEIVMQCLTASEAFYTGFNGREDLEREEVTVDGRSGYRITSELRVSDPEVTYGGDQTTVIVLDTGDADSFGLFLGVVPLGESAYEAELEDTIEAIKVG